MSAAAGWGRPGFAFYRLTLGNMSFGHPWGKSPAAVRTRHIIWVLVWDRRRQIRYPSSSGKNILHYTCLTNCPQERLVLLTPGAGLHLLKTIRKHGWEGGIERMEEEIRSQRLEGQVRQGDRCRRRRGRVSVCSSILNMDHYRSLRSV